MAQISVIVPVYGGEKYLNECIESILMQSFADFELILIDDESPDKCGKICDDYAKKDIRIRVIHQKNRGINGTRKRGVNEAIGKWIAFVDDDDTLPYDALESLITISDNTDLVIGYPFEPCKKDLKTLEDFKRAIITAKDIPPTPWGKLFRRTVLNEKIFDFPREIDGEEDMIMNTRLIFSLQRAPKLLLKKVYNHRLLATSVSHTKKASLEHEELFDQCRRDAIPTNEFDNYLGLTIWSRINGLYGVGYSNPNSLCNKEHTFLLKLFDDIKRNNYKLSYYDKIFLSSKNPKVIKTLAFFELTKRSLTYRLGLKK